MAVHLGGLDVYREVYAVLRSAGAQLLVTGYIVPRYYTYVGNYGLALIEVPGFSRA